jgi:predicted amidohydrolase YtcJ
MPTMRRGLGPVLFLLAIVASAPAVRADEPADLVLRHGRVFTAEPDAPLAEAVAVREGRLVAVGKDAAVEALVGPATTVIDLQGRLVVPGFIDAHVHLLAGALSLGQVDLAGANDLSQVQARIKSWSEANPKKAWVLGGGWAYSAFPGGLPTRRQLDAVVANRPAFIDAYDGHTGWANSRALALAGITKATKDPEGGTIVRDPRTGEPTGALKESAKTLVSAKVPEPSPVERNQALLRGLRLLSASGITSVEDAGLLSGDPSADLALLDGLRHEGKLSVRVAAAIRVRPDSWTEDVALAKRLAARYNDPWLRVLGVKLFVDGVVEAKTAAMLEPFVGGGTGLPNFSPEALRDAVVAADTEGLQVFLHAIGDRGVRMALDAHEAALRANGRLDRRGRIEHIENLDPADLGRFKPLAVIASMQPLHAEPNANLLGVWAPNVGPEREARGFNWARLEGAGARLVFGSDWPVVTPDVLQGLYCAVTRKTREGTPPGGWHPEQAVTLESALRHYTIDGAFASFEQGDKGSLVVGKRADLTVLSENVLAGPPELLLKARVLMTVVDGKIVHRIEQGGAASHPLGPPLAARE